MSCYFRCCRFSSLALSGISGASSAAAAPLPLFPSLYFSVFVGSAEPIVLFWFFVCNFFFWVIFSWFLCFNLLLLKVIEFIF